MLKRFLILVALAVSPLLARENYEYTDSAVGECFSPSKFFGFCKGNDAFVDFLYWKPCGTELDWVAERTGDVATYYTNIDPDWVPAFRVGLTNSTFFRAVTVEASYLYIHQHTKRTIEANEGNLVSPLIHEAIYAYAPNFLPTEGEAVYNYSFHSWDALLSKSAKVKSFNFNYFAGAAGIVLDQTLESALINPAIEESLIRHRWKSDLEAFGLKIGTYGEYRAASAGNLYFFLSGILLAGDNEGYTDHLVQQGEVDQNWRFDEPKRTCYLIPGLHLGAGFDYHTEILCFDLTWKVGYEFVKYWNMPSIRGFTGYDNNDYIAISTPPNIGSFGFHGWTLGIVSHF